MHVSGKGTGITELDLGKVFTTPTARESLALVSSLDLSTNKLKVIDSLQPLISLVSLDLSYNVISTLANLPPTLQRLTLHHNRLGSLEWLSALPSLQQLDISFNKLTSLSRLPHDMPLQVLLADGNSISTLADSPLGSFKLLRMLSLNSNLINSLREVTDGLGRIPCLEALSLEGCPLTEINTYRKAVIHGLRHLKTLDGTPVMRDDSDDDDVQENREESGLHPSDAISRSTHSITTSRNHPKDLIIAQAVKTVRTVGGDHSAKVRQTSATLYEALGEHVQKQDSYESSTRQQNEFRATIAQLRKALKDTAERYQCEHDENTTLRATINSLENRKTRDAAVIAGQLDTIAQLTAERDAAVEALRRSSTKVQRQSSELRYSRNKAAADATNYEIELERSKVKSLLDSQFGLNRTSAVADRASICSQARNTSAASTLHASRISMATNPALPSANVSSVAPFRSRRSASLSATPAHRDLSSAQLASQLKSWMLSEIHNNSTSTQ